METIDKRIEDCEDVVSSYIDEGENYILAHEKDEPFDILIKWEGIVQEIEGDTIYSKMYCLEDGENYDLEFDVSEVPSDDIDLIVEGALFNLYIGYDKKVSGAKKSKLLKFRRIHLTNKLNSVLESLKENDLRSLVEDY